MNLRKKKKLMKLKELQDSLARLAEAAKSFVPPMKADAPAILKAPLQCYMCKEITEINPGRIKHWRLDCSHCANKHKVVSLTYFTRDELGRSSFTDFKLKSYEIFFKLNEEDSTTYAWKFNFLENKTTCTRIEKDVKNPVVTTVDSILPITIENMRNKIKLALVFG